MSMTAVPINPRVTVETLRRALLQVGPYARENNLPEELVESAVQRRGEEAYLILDKMVLMPGEDVEERYWCSEADFSIRHEMCLNLVDFYWRRSPLFLFHSDHGMGYLTSIASIFAKKLGWSESYTEMQMSAVEISTQRETKAIADAMR